MFKQLRDDIACILERDPAARTRWEVLTCYPGLHALYIHKLAHWFWIHGLRWLRPLSSPPSPRLTRIEISSGAEGSQPPTRGVKTPSQRRPRRDPKRTRPDSSHGR